MNKLFFLILLIPIICWAKIIRIIEIDTGIDRSHKEINDHLPKSSANILDYYDLNGHGTHIAGIILKGTCKEVQLESCSYFDILNPRGSFEDYINCLKLAINDKPDIINISAGGTNFDQDEFDLLTILSNMGVKIVTAAGNNAQDLNKFDYFPAKYKITNVIPVGNLDVDGKRNITSNYGLENEVYESGTKILSTLPDEKYGVMSGTSMSAAKKSNRLLLEMCNKNAKVH